MSNFPKLKLVYFNAAGRAEAVRLAFHIGNVPFEDHRFTYADFNALKPTFPYAQAPVLEVDGEAVAQSQGILRYAGRLANLYPVNDPLAALKVDEILNAFDELQDKMSPSFREQDPEKKKAMREELAKTTIPHYLRFFEARLLKMKEYPVFAKGDIFIHDITIYAFMRIIRNGVLDHVPTDLVDSYVEINASAAKVENHHRVKEWYANPRNVTPKFKLTYFAGPGRAEPIRLAFHIGGVEFEDERIDWAEFEKRRASLPFGQVPVLDVNGDVLAQSLPILRYVGTITGLYPANDPLLAMRIDEFLGAIDELYNSMQPTYRMEPEAQLAARKVLVETTFQKLLSAADKRVATKGGKYAVGDKLTVSDLAIHGVVLGMTSGNMNGIPTTFTDQFENLTRIFKLVQEHPKVHAYVAAKK